MNHLIEPKRDPKTFRGQIVKAAKITRARLDSIHCKMNHKIQNGEPPKTGIPPEDYGEGGGAMNRAMNRQRPEEIPSWAAFLQHVDVLKDEIGKKMLDMKNNEQEKKPLDVIHVN